MSNFTRRLRKSAAEVTGLHHYFEDDSTRLLREAREEREEREQIAAREEREQIAAREKIEKELDEYENGLVNGEVGLQRQVSFNISDQEEEQTCFAWVLARLFTKVIRNQ